MRRLAALVLLLPLAACGEASSDEESRDAIPEVAQQVRERYADCLAALDAKLDARGPALVSFETKSGLLVFKIGKKLPNGNYVATPRDFKDERILAAAGC